MGTSVGEGPNSESPATEASSPPELDGAADTDEEAGVENKERVRAKETVRSPNAKVSCATASLR